jgi:hypothetical protein
MNDYMTAIHEAGHAVVLASLGHARDIAYVTATPNFVPPERAAIAEGLGTKVAVADAAARL